MVVPSCTTSQSFIPQSRKQPLVVQGRVKQSQSISLSILEFVFFGENVRTYWDATVDLEDLFNLINIFTTNNLPLCVYEIVKLFVVVVTSDNMVKGRGVNLGSIDQTRS